jgi:hypothetical protein
MRDLFGLEISEGALVNLLEDSAAVLNAAESRLHREAALEVRRIDPGS